MNHHPQSPLMEKFALGELSSPLASMLSAHVEICEECKNTYSSILQKETKLSASTPVSFSRSEMDSIFSKMMSNLESEDQISKNNVMDEPISVNVSGQVIPLPRSMSFLSKQKIAWKEFGKKNAIAPVAQTSKGNFYLIYIGPGEVVPHHDHSDTEYSYVVAGSYDDGISSFSTGDFAVSKHGYNHSPKATSDDGCLVLSWVEGRLNYFSGILKPLNSILWWYLHRA